MWLRFRCRALTRLAHLVGHWMIQPRGRRVDDLFTEPFSSPNHSDSPSSSKCFSSTDSELLTLVLRCLLIKCGPHFQEFQYPMPFADQRT